MSHRRSSLDIKIVLEYDGTNYHGWQRQSSSGGATIQGTLEKAIERISGEQATVIGAGRTDAGVHALGQVAHFRTRSRLSPVHWQRALNSLLPPDITVVGAEKVTEKFHARRRATAKIYQYRILHRAPPSPLLRFVSWHVPHHLNIRTMKAAAVHLLGAHDFSSFQTAGSPSRSALCRITRIEIAQTGDLITILIEADRFLRHMVRTIVGTLVEAARGKMRPSHVKEILQAKDRRLAGPPAPPHGLFLMKVKYEVGSPFYVAQEGQRRRTVKRGSFSIPEGSSSRTRGLLHF